MQAGDGLWQWWGYYVEFYVLYVICWYMRWRWSHYVGCVVFLWVNEWFMSSVISGCEISQPHWLESTRELELFTLTNGIQFWSSQINWLATTLDNHDSCQFTVILKVYVILHFVHICFHSNSKHLMVYINN